MRSIRETSLRTSAALALVLSAGTASAGPVLWGYGVKTCAQFLDAAPGNSAPASIAGDEFLRYREWLAGLVSGLNLASGSDVLGGAQLDAAVAKIHARCKDEPNQDFFNASIEVIKTLSRH